ncbi:hypothetical protein DFH09DRAFT_1096753 [Mycena vulgaris]|nr:hypothetical protein DFH09DRAFT_1096753 [Mycena vulgaris]
MGNTADKYEIPAGLNNHFRHPLDAADDFMAAFERAVAFSAILGDNRVSNLWQRALEIGFLAGRGAMETAPMRGRQVGVGSVRPGGGRGLRLRESARRRRAGGDDVWRDLRQTIATIPMRSAECTATLYLVLI